ncbi:MAG: SUMF1/EgtB/PvdO family nonheme iron enzyme [Candidatus Binatia bacterium]
MRGGSWLVPPRAARTSDRVWYGPGTRSMGVGFRCAQ